MSVKAYYHLPGLFEFYEFYKEFLRLYHEHREYFYEWSEIGSIYGAPSDCIWGGGRVEDGQCEPGQALELLRKYGISARLTFSNSLLSDGHLKDKRCNELCEILSKESATAMDKNTKSGECIDLNSQRNGAIVFSDLLVKYLRENYSNLYLVSSTTKVLTDFNELKDELSREEFRYVVLDFRLNKSLDMLGELSKEQKDKVEFLCNECCDFGCVDRKACYEDVSRINLGEKSSHICRSLEGQQGYKFSKAMKNPGFISLEDIRNVYMPMGFSQFKIEGRGLGSALILEFVLYYMTKPEYHLQVREELYLDNSLDLF